MFLRVCINHEISLQSSDRLQKWPKLCLVGHSQTIRPHSTPSCWVRVGGLNEKKIGKTVASQYLQAVGGRGAELPAYYVHRPCVTSSHLMTSRNDVIPPSILIPRRHLFPFHLRRRQAPMPCPLPAGGHPVPATQIITSKRAEHITSTAVFITFLAYNHAMQASTGWSIKSANVHRRVTMTTESSR